MDRSRRCQNRVHRAWQPGENGYCESFNSKLDGEIFYSLAEARIVIESVLELVVSNEVDDLLRRDADIAVRMTAPVQQALLARRVASAELGLHARADYLARRGTPGTLADLRRFDLIGYDRTRISRCARAAR